MCCFRIWYPIGVKTISSHAHKTGSWYLLGILDKNSDKHPNSFYVGVPPPSTPRGRGNDLYIYKLFYYLCCFSALLFWELVRFQDAFVHCKNDFHLYVIAPLNIY